MQQKWVIFALTALLTVGLTGCGSGNGETGSYNTDGRDAVAGGNGAQRDKGDSAVDGYGGTGGTNNDANGNSGILGDIGDGINDVGRGIGEAFNDAGDALTGNDGTDGADRYQDMLENGRVHDSDGYLLDGENRHD